jgi:hypothetical protein
MTKVKMIPTLFVVGLLGVGAWMFAPSIKNLMDEDDGGVILLVEFEPARRSGKPLRPGGNLLDRISIQVTVGNHPTGPTETAVSSPWERVIYPAVKSKRGVGIELYAEQFTGGLLRCMIRQHGHGPVNDDGAGATTVRCRYTVV